MRMLPDTEQALHVVTLRDLVAEAQKIMPPFAFAYVSGRAEDDWTMPGILASFNQWIICTWSFAGHKLVNTPTRLLCADVSYPVIAAGVGNQGSVHASLTDPVVKGTAQAGTIFVERSGSQTSLVDLSISITNSEWLQIYLPASWSFAVDMLPPAKVPG